MAWWGAVVPYADLRGTTSPSTPLYLLPLLGELTCDVEGMPHPTTVSVSGTTGRYPWAQGGGPDTVAPQRGLQAIQGEC